MIQLTKLERDSTCVCAHHVIGVATKAALLGSRFIALPLSFADCGTTGTDHRHAQFGSFR
jgi:hypothetical protein